MRRFGTIYEITLPLISGGIIVDNGKVVVAAPTLAWTRDKPLEEVRAWVAHKQGTMETVYEDRGGALR